VNINVRASASAAPSHRSSASAHGRQARAANLGRGLVFIKDAPGTLRPLGARLYHRGSFWLAQLVPLLAWIAVGSYDRRRRRLAGDTRYARFTRPAAAHQRSRKHVRHWPVATLPAVAIVAAAIRDYLVMTRFAPGAVEETAAARYKPPA
jgi:hypothetical protein